MATVLEMQCIWLFCVQQGEAVSNGRAAENEKVEATQREDRYSIGIAIAFLELVIHIQVTLLLHPADVD